MRARRPGPVIQQTVGMLVIMVIMVMSVTVRMIVAVTVAMVMTVTTRRVDRGPVASASACRAHQTTSISLILISIPPEG